LAHLELQRDLQGVFASGDFTTGKNCGKRFYPDSFTYRVDFQMISSKSSSPSNDLARGVLHAFISERSGP
jgi:hypothetical protein